MIFDQRSLLCSLSSHQQCRERWNNHLAPGINRGGWTCEEEAALVEAHKAYGNRWAAIAATLPGRTENSVKNHWNATLRRKLRVPGSPAAVSAGGDGQQLASPASPALAVAVSTTPSVLQEYILALSLTSQDRSSTKRGLSASPSTSGWADEEEEAGGGGGVPTRRSLSSNQLCRVDHVAVETPPCARLVRQSRLVAEASIAAVAAAEAADELLVEEADDLLPARQPRRLDGAAPRGKKGLAVEAPVPPAAQGDHMMGSGILGGVTAGGVDALLPWSMDDMDDLLGGPHNDWFSLDLAMMEAPWNDPAGFAGVDATGAAAGAAAAWNPPPLAVAPAQVEPATAAAGTLGRAVMCTSETSRPVSPGTPTDAASVITPGGTCSAVGPLSHSGGEVAQLTPMLLDSATSPRPRHLLGASHPLDLSLIGEELMGSDYDWAADMAQAVGLLEPAQELRGPVLASPPRPASRHGAAAPPVASRRAVFHPQPSVAVHAPAPGAAGMVTAGDVPSLCGDILRVQYGTLDAASLMKTAMGGLCRPQGKGMETATYTCAIPRPGLVAKKVKHTLHHGMPLAQVPLPPGGECQAAIASVAAKLRARWPDTVRLVLVLRCDAATPGEVVLCGSVTSPLWAKSIAAVTFAVETLKDQMPRLRHVVRV